MDPGAIPFILLGLVFGWIWKRGHVALLDVRSAKGRLSGARKVFRREILWTAGFAILAFAVVRILA